VRHCDQKLGNPQNMDPSASTDGELDYASSSECGNHSGAADYCKSGEGCFAYGSRSLSYRRSQSLLQQVDD